MYVVNAPLNGETYTYDTQKVHTLLLTFISEYPDMEAIVRTATQDDGKEAYLAMANRFEGTGALTVEILDAEQIIKEIFYSGEKKPNMYWEKFEKELKYAYSVVDRRAGRIVHDDVTKLRTLLNDKIKADFLKTTVAVLKIQLGSMPLTLTFQNALDSIRNEVNNHIRDHGGRFCTT